MSLLEVQPWEEQARNHACAAEAVESADTTAALLRQALAYIERLRTQLTFVLEALS